MSPPDPAAHRITVLVVDDHESSARGLALVLKAYGCASGYALTGREGLARARAERPQAVLLDLSLPDLDGRDVARELRADPELDGTLLVAVTGYGGPELVREILAAGFHAHVGKPVDPQRLLAVLGAREELVARRQNRAEG